jgi:hypothetical protein
MTRRIPVWKIAAVACVLATAIVLGAIPSRWEGRRIGTDAWIPLRPPTPAEAAALIRFSEDEGGGFVRIVGLSDDEVRLASAFYLYPADDGRSESGEELGEITVEGRRLRIASATWEAYWLLYRVDRVALEAALGRAIPDDEVRDYGNRTVSFRPDFLPLYAIAEIAMLSAWAIAVAWPLLRWRRLTLVLPALYASSAVLFLCVLDYSPAHVDADAFYQRIVVEDLAFVAFFFPTPAIASAVLFALLVFAEAIARRRGASVRRYRYGAAAALVAAIAAFGAFRFVGYRLERRTCDELLEPIAARARADSFDFVENLRGGPPKDRGSPNLLHAGAEPAARAAAERLLGPALPGHTIQIFVSAGAAGDPDPPYLFLWNGPGPYADFRRLRPEQTDYEPIAAAGSARERIHTGFARYLAGRHVCGEAVEHAGRRAIVTIAEDRFAPRAPVFGPPR